MKESNISHSYFAFKSQNPPEGAEKEKKYMLIHEMTRASLSSFMRIGKKRRKRRKII